MAPDLRTNQSENICDKEEMKSCLGIRVKDKHDNVPCTCSGEDGKLNCANTISSMENA